MPLQAREIADIARVDDSSTPERSRRHDDGVCEGRSRTELSPDDS